MQTKLRIFGLLVVANVLWSPITTAAPMSSKSLKAVKSLKLQLCRYRVVVWKAAPRTENGKRQAF